MTGLREGRAALPARAGLTRQRASQAVDGEGFPARARRLGRRSQAACAKGRNGVGRVQGDVPADKAEARVGRVYP